MNLNGPDPIPVALAQERLFALASSLPMEIVSLANATGRWAGMDVTAIRTQPVSDLSAMDGFAIRFAERPGPWKIVVESAAGAASSKRLEPGEAARIFTGAIIPEGADCVLIQEDARWDGEVLQMTGRGPKGTGGNVRRCGSDFQAAETLYTAGESINARRVALAAVAGHAALCVHRRLRVTIISTGDELVPPGHPLKRDQLPASNALMLCSLLAGWPVIVEDLGIVRDDLESIAQAFTRAAATADIIVSSGGVSIGDRDLIQPALKYAGAKIDFWRVAMRPGKPLLAGKLGAAVVLGLPGNPVSSYVTACLFLLPLIAHMCGAADPLPRTRFVRSEHRSKRTVLGMIMFVHGSLGG